jgi:hypothetical protein
MIWKRAIASETKVVPVLLDDTSLAAELGQF